MTWIYCLSVVVGGFRHARTVERALESRLTVAELSGSPRALQRRLNRIGAVDPAFDHDELPSLYPVGSRTADWVVTVRPPTGDALPYNVLLRPDPRSPHRVQALRLQNPTDNPGGPILGQWTIRHGLLLGEGGILLSAADGWFGGLQVFWQAPDRVLMLQGYETEDNYQQPEWHIQPNGDAILCTRLDDFRIFTAPHAGPYLTHVNRYRESHGRFRLIQTHVYRNALEAFDRLADAVATGHWGAVRRLIPNPSVRRTAIHALLLELKTHDPYPFWPRVVGPGYEDRGTTFRFELEKRPVYRFAKLHGAWRLVSVR